MVSPRRAMWADRPSARSKAIARGPRHVRTWADEDLDRLRRATAEANDLTEAEEARANESVASLAQGCTDLTVLAEQQRLRLSALTVEDLRRTNGGAVTGPRT